MHYQEIKGDLFSNSGKDALVHCVSKDLNMGKGIAVEFKKQFGGIAELMAQNKDVGQVAVLPHSSRKAVFYLITKKKYWWKPTIQSLKSSLLSLKKRCEELNITSLSMPKIGCGLDGLDWKDVSTMIQDIFKDTKLDITVYYI